MKLRRKTFSHLSASLLLIALGASGPAHAGHYQFSQDGFVTRLLLDNRAMLTFTGGKIVGSFDGEDTMDKNGNPGTDGLIAGAIFGESEITNFTFSLSGNEYFDSFYNSAEGFFDGDSSVVYDTNTKSLSLNFAWEGSYNPEFITSLTDITILDFIGRSQFSTSHEGSALFSNPVYIEGYDQDGNPIDLSRGLSLESQSEQPITTTVGHLPIPGGLILFMSGLLGLIGFRKNRVN
jgi:hypothetical protein